MVRVGDEVVLFDPFWNLGENIGDSLGRVISTESYVLVDVYDYHSNPVKCFRRDFEVIKGSDLGSNQLELDLDDLFGRQ
jgi:hypothetical protein